VEVGIAKTISMTNDSVNVKAIEKQNMELKEKVERYQQTIRQLKEEKKHLNS
jgi:predicted RNase H-like nuclease (RuvC/YqgF family)